jgi:hypothetical protein
MKVLLGVILILLVGCGVPIESGQNEPAKDAKVDNLSEAMPMPEPTMSLDEVNRMRAEVGLAPRENTPAPSARVETDAQVAALTQKVAELEDQLNEVEAILQEQIEDVRWEQQWTENDAIVLTRYQLWERASSCHLDSCGRDPVLRMFSGGLATRSAQLRDTYMELVTDALLKSDRQWSAVHEPENRRWRVETLLEGSENSLVFYAYERAGIVEAEVPSKE